jgi:hypothetical protein
MCCGGNRAAARAAAMAAQSARARPVAMAPAPPASVIIFEYVGPGSAWVRGPVSGQLYQFAFPGHRLRVDPRDRPDLATSPSLRWVR